MLTRSAKALGKGAHTKVTEATIKAATLTKREAARVRAGHPWVYRSDVAEAVGDAGDVVRIVYRNGRFLGRAFYNPKSQITLRVATREDEEIDEAWLRNRLETARAYRDSLTIDASAYRLLHAEADGIPGLVVDRYGDHLVLQVRFQARLRMGQKTGGFLDQRENHLAAASYAGGAGRVLDVFSYAGGFALHAARVAEHVEAVDSSGEALEAARADAELNGLSGISFTRANAFDLLRERSDRGERYDTVILDPPAFAKTRRELPGAVRAYKEINLRAMKLLESGGVLVTCSCSYQLSRETMEETLRSAAADAGRTVRVREWRGQALDHPEILTIPETRYLKCAVLECL